MLFSNFFRESKICRFSESFVRFPVFGTTEMSIGKEYKKIDRIWRKILTRMFFHKIFVSFSSLSHIYKVPSMRYNKYAVGKSRQVPFFCTLQGSFCEMSILWHHGVDTTWWCAIFIFREPIWWGNRSIFSSKSRPLFFFCRFFVNFLFLMKLFFKIYGNIEKNVL